jgi:hypothetical protein
MELKMNNSINNLALAMIHYTNGNVNSAARLLAAAASGPDAVHTLRFLIKAAEAAEENLERKEPTDKDVKDSAEVKAGDFDVDTEAEDKNKDRVDPDAVLEDDTVTEEEYTPVVEPDPNTIKDYLDEDTTEDDIEEDTSIESSAKVVNKNKSNRDKDTSTLANEGKVLQDKAKKKLASSNLNASVTKLDARLSRALHNLKSSTK